MGTQPLYRGGRAVGTKFVIIDGTQRDSHVELSVHIRKAHLRGSWNEWRGAYKQEAKDDQEATNGSDNFGHQLPVTHPAPAGGG